MAKITESEKLIHQHARGNLEKAKHLRDILNPAKVNHLILLESEINAIINFIDDPTTDTGYTAQTDQDLKSHLLASPRVSTLDGELGSEVAEAQIYSFIKKKYIDILNKTVIDGDPYQLGHEVGLTTRQIQIMKETYDPKPSTFSARRKALLNKALKASAVIDTIERKLMRSMESKITKSGFSDTDLVVALKAAGGKINTTVSIEKRVSNNLKDAKLIIGLRAEKKSVNQFTGNLSNAVSRLLRKALTSNKESEIIELEKLFANVDMVNLRGSPSIVDVTKSNINYAFDPKKHKKPIKANITRSRVSKSLPGEDAALLSLHKRVKKRVLVLKT